MTKNTKKFRKSQRSNILDLDISINREGKFSCRVYDKRDKFGFKVVKFQPLMSNQASSVLYAARTVHRL